MSKTNPLVQRIGNSLGLVTQEQVSKEVEKAKNEIAETVKKSLSTQNRPDLRSSMLVGQAVAPEMKAGDYLKAYTGWVYACVNVIAQETSNIELTLKRRKGQNEYEIIDKHPSLDLLYKVNPLYTSYDLWESTQAYMELLGEAFWYTVGPTNNPKEIWVLRPDWIEIKDSKSKLIDHYTYGPPGDRKLKIPYEQMIHFKDFNPRNMFRGYGPTRGGAKSIDENNFQQDYSRNFFYNSALPGGALETDQNLEDEQYERIRDDWEAVHRGPKKAWKIAILEAGLKWQDIGLSQREMDFAEGRRLTRDEVMAIYRVPKPMLTFDDVNRAAAREARAILLENVISHKQKRLAATLTEFLLPRYKNDELFFDYVDPTPNDQKQALDYYDSGLKHGWLTRNEVRELENLEPVDGLDKFMIPFSLQDVGAEADDKTKTANNQRRLNKANVRTAPYSFFKYKMEQIQDNLTQVAERVIRSLMKQPVKPVHKLSTNVENREENIEEGEIVDDTREQRWRSVIARTDPREAKYKHLITDLLTTQQEKVNNAIDQGLTKSKKQTVRKSTINDVASIVESDTTVFAEVLMDFIRTVIEAEGIQQIQSILEDGIFFMQTPNVQNYLKTEGVKFIMSINEETAEQLRDALSDGIANQESISQLKERVSKIYEDARGYRAERIARSEVIRATNFATEEAYKQSKVVEKKEWLTAHDERTCPWCREMDGVVIDLQDDFFKLGDTFSATNDKGKKVSLNIGVSDVGYPPLHPNCRCTLVPIITTDDKSAKPIKKDLLSELANATLKEIQTSIKD